MNNNVFQKTAELEKSDIIPHRGVLRPRDYEKDFSFARYRVPDDLASYIAYIWIIRWSFEDNKTHQSVSVLASPEVNLFFASEGAGVQGVFKTSRTYSASGTSCVAGVAFKPGGFYAFWPHSVSKLTGKYMAISDVFPRVDTVYVKKLLKQNNESIYTQLLSLLRSRLLHQDDNIALIQDIIERIDDKTLNSVKEVADAFTMSERRLQYLFQTYVGVGVKWILQRNRLLAAVEAAQTSVTADINWTMTALDLGYASQAHFITDFKRITGLTPTAYIRWQHSM